MVVIIVVVVDVKVYLHTLTRRHLFRRHLEPRWGAEFDLGLDVHCRWQLLGWRCHCSMPLILLCDVDVDALEPVFFVISFVFTVPFVVRMSFLMLPIFAIFFFLLLSMLLLTRLMMLMPFVMLILMVPILFSLNPWLRAARSCCKISSGLWRKFRRYRLMSECHCSMCTLHISVI